MEGRADQQEDCAPEPPINTERAVWEIRTDGQPNSIRPKIRQQQLRLESRLLVSDLGNPLAVILCAGEISCTLRLVVSRERLTMQQAPPPSMKVILALDQGTTSSRAIVFDRDGNALGLAQREFKQHFPHSGWVEHDAGEIWQTQVEVAQEALRAAGLAGTDLAAIGITNQRETTVLWDRVTGEPVHHAIVWQDRRTAKRCDELRQAGHEELFQSRTGLRLDPYFSGTKLEWLLDNVSGARARAECGELAFGTIDTWLLWNLTGGTVHATDPSNASRTLLFNIHELKWDDDLLKVLNIPRAVLPEVRDSSGEFGRSSDTTGFGDCPIAGIAGDQQAALFGQTCFESGKAKNTYGTGCFLLLNTGDRPVASKNRLLTTVGWSIEGQVTYALEGSVFIAGALVQWLRDGLGIIKSAKEIEALASSVPDAAGAVVVPAFAGLGAPHWDPYARGTICGLTRGVTAAHLARAALESIAHQSRELLEAMERDAGVPLSELRVDGGASANDLLLQIQSDFVGVPVVRPKMIETTAYGAACLAGLAVGFWASQTELADRWAVDQQFTPQRKREELQDSINAWTKAVKRAAHWVHDSAE